MITKKINKMKRIVFISTMLMLSVVASAKSYKIGPSSVTGMNFASINAAMSSVSAGDTLLLDKAYKETTEQTVTKSVVIIGNGFDTTTSTIAQVNTLSLKADGIQVNSLYVTKVIFYNKDCRLYRCFVGSSASGAGTSSSATGQNSIHSCYFTGTINGGTLTNIFDIQNTILYTNTNNVISNLTNSNICHCIIYGEYYSYSNVYLINNVSSSSIIDNIIVNNNTYSPSSYRDKTISNYSVSSMNTIHHNVMSGFENTTNYPLNAITNSNSLSGICKCSGTTVSGTYFKLSSNSPALNYASDGSDCGIYGGLYPYVDYGRPIYVPYFTNISVPAKATNGILPISVTVEVQNK